MHIVHVISGYLPHDTAGTQIQLRDLCRGQRARGHRVEVFTRLAGNEHAEFELSRSEWEGVAVTRVTNNFADLDRFELLYTHPIIDARFDAYLEHTRPDLVHVHHLTCLSTSMIEVARRRHIPIVMGLHDYWMQCLRGQRIRPDDLEICTTLDRDRCLRCLNQLWPHLLPLSGPRSLWDRVRGRPPSLSKLLIWDRHVRRMLQACQAFTAPSRFHRARFVDAGVPAKRIFAAPYGLPLDELRGATRPQRPLRHIGYIGSVIPSKGVHVLCSAFAQLDRRDLVLDLHGEMPSFHGDTGYPERLRSLLPAHLDVRFHGRYEQREVPRILANLDLLVVPSLWWESFCLTAREGALAGLPVVASRLGALEDAVADGIAIGFKAGDANDLARVLAQMIDGPGTPAPRTDHILNLDASVGRMEQIYRFALGSGPAVDPDGGAYSPRQPTQG